MYTNTDRMYLRPYKSIIEKNKLISENSIFTSSLTLGELKAAIQCLDHRKSPGPDLIYGQMIKHLGVLAKKTLLHIFNISWHTGKLLRTWKHPTILPIFKPTKDATNCKSYHFLNQSPLQDNRKDHSHSCFTNDSQQLYEEH